MLRPTHWFDTSDADAVGLSAFRAIFGAIMLFSVVRFAWMGWIESTYVSPDWHFSYPVFEWATAPDSAALIYVVFVAMGAAAASLMAGWFPRVSAGVFCVLFTWVELWERATYLNHYYFVTLVALLLAIIPTAGYFSVRPSASQRRVGRLGYTALRGLVGLVYFWAGVAKLNADWLLHGEPLATWLLPHADLFTLGGALELEWVALAMSWGGAGFDLSIWLFLWGPRTRKVAFVVAVAFHVTVGILFPIGVFPTVMIGAITIFFAPSWPRRLGGFDEPMNASESAESGQSGASRTPRLAVWTVAGFLVVQSLLPARSFLYPGQVNWNDDGFKWSWRVMLVERVGSVEYRVETPDGAIRVHPRERLTELQYKMLTVTPDMILEYAHHLSERHGGAAVYATSQVAFNGRRSQVWIDPEVDLSRVSRWAFHDAFVLPLE